MIMNYVVLMEQSGSSCVQNGPTREQKYFFFIITWLNSNIESYLYEYEQCTHKNKFHWNYMQSNTFLNCYLLCAFLSFYERKYAVFLRLFAHQREYQALMNQRWCSLRHRAVLVQTLFRVTIAMTSPHTGNKNSGPYHAGFLFLLLTLMVQFFLFCYVPSNLNSLSLLNVEDLSVTLQLFQDVSVTLKCNPQ